MEAVVAGEGDDAPGTAGDGVEGVDSSLAPDLDG